MQEQVSVGPARQQERQVCELQDLRVRRHVLGPDRHAVQTHPLQGRRAQPGHGQALKRAVICAAQAPGEVTGLGCASK